MVTGRLIAYMSFRLHVDSPTSKSIRLNDQSHDESHYQ